MSMAEDTRKRPDFSDYSSDTPREQGADPLAELARLIGQSDPFTALAKRKPFDAVRQDDRPAPEWLARPAAPAHDDYDPPPAPRQAFPQPDYRAQRDSHAEADHAESNSNAEIGEYSEDTGYDHHPPDDRYRVALPSGQY